MAGEGELIHLVYYLPFYLPICHTEAGPLARRLDQSIFPSACERTSHNTQHPVSAHEGAVVIFHQRTPPTRTPHTRGWWWPGSDDGACVRLSARGNRTPPGRFADVNRGSRPLDPRVVGGGKKVKKGRGAGRTKWREKGDKTDGYPPAAGAVCPRRGYQTT